MLEEMSIGYLGRPMDVHDALSRVWPFALRHALLHKALLATLCTH